MRIATWNLDRCHPGKSDRKERLAEQMAHVNADVWVLTESFRDFAPGDDHRLVASSVDAPDRDAAAGECWVAIWVRCAVPAARVELAKDTQRAAAASVYGGVIVVGTVLPWLADPRDLPRRGTDAFLARLEEQAGDWRQLREVAPARCVAGDFNQDLLSNGHYYGSAAGRDALRAALAGAGLKPLTDGADDPLRACPGLACIDHICVSGLRPPSHPRSSAWPEPGTLRRSLTDHYCIWVDVE
jgi:endonuclease/exonuclease/phosphatase family metal-dependent hydrolase